GQSAGGSEQLSDGREPSSSGSGQTERREQSSAPSSGGSGQSAGGSGRTAIMISAADNVATALEPIAAGQTGATGGVRRPAAEVIPRGHKIALRAIRAGEVVTKYGSAIGTASADIAAGAHVHTHNVASARGRGDLAR